jgi:DNA repair protein RadC
MEPAKLLRICDLPLELRPRERLLRAGESSLDDAGLIAVMLGTGTRGVSALDLARGLLAAAGGLYGLAAWTPAQIARHAGIGPARGARIAAAMAAARRLDGGGWAPGVQLDGTAKVVRHFRAAFRGHRQECLAVVLLDARHRLLRDVVVATGGLTQCMVEPREVFGLALREAAAGVVCVHNHPSGDATPSADDVLLTRRLEQAGIVVGVPLLDHVIVGEGGEYSFAERGLLRESSILNAE